jgi:hypothetical protein
MYNFLDYFCQGFSPDPDPKRDITIIIFAVLPVNTVYKVRLRLQLSL